MTDHSEATLSTRQFAPLAIIVGIPLIFAALFFYTSPIALETNGGQGIFKCGSPSSPNVESETVCGVPESIARNKAIYSGLSGVALVGLGAVWLLRGQRPDDDWEEDVAATDADRERPARRRDDVLAEDGDSAPRERGARRRSILRDDDFEDRPRRRMDDDWSSDGWR